MTSRLRLALFGALGAGLIAVGAYFAVGGGLFDRTQKICLETDVAFIAGAMRKCYAPADVAGLMGAAVLDDQDTSAAVSLSHPTDLDSGLAEVGTCKDYLARKGAGWYAPSTREARREGWFVRACGVLSAISGAAKEEVTHFAGGRLSEADVRALAASGAIRFGPDGPPGVFDVAKDEAGRWRIVAEGQIVLIQEIAHADFDRDGRADVLAYIDVRPEGGTAQIGVAGLIDKSSDEAQPRFTPLSPLP